MVLLPVLVLLVVGQEEVLEVEAQQVAVLVV